MLVDGEEEGVLGVGPRVQGTRRDTGPLAERSDGEAFVPAVLEELDAGVEDPVPLLARALLPRRADGQVALDGRYRRGWMPGITSSSLTAA